MDGIRIVATGSALPSRSLTNEEMSSIVDTTDEWIQTRTGIKSRRVCAEGESCVTLAVKAASNAIEKAGIDPNEIGAVICATSTPDYAFPSVACMVQKGLGLSEELMAFDLSAACTGFLYALGVGRGLLRNMGKPYVLLIGCEQLSTIVDYTDRGTCILFGDGAGAVILAASDKKFYQKSWARGCVEALNSVGIGRGEAKISMKGNDVFKFAVNAMKQGLDEVLADTGLTMEDIDWCICHQANKRIIAHVQKQFPGQEDKFFINIEELGNTSAASIPIALDQMMREGKLSAGMKIVCVGFGAGLTWSGALIEL